MKKVYIKPVMIREKFDIECILNLQSGGTTGQKGITTAGSRNLIFDDEEEDYSDNANDDFFRSW